MVTYMREQVVWHLWSFTFLSVTNFLDSLSRTVGVPYHLYAELVRSKSSIQFFPKLQQKSGYTIYSIPLFKKANNIKPTTTAADENTENTKFMLGKMTYQNASKIEIFF